MASITIRNLDDGVKTGLRKRAAINGRSMEEEVRLILREVGGGECRTERSAGRTVFVGMQSLNCVSVQIVPEPHFGVEACAPGLDPRYLQGSLPRSRQAAKGT